MERGLNALLAGLLGLSLWLSMHLGPVDVEVWRGLLDWLRGIDSDAALIIAEVRLPRGLLAMLIGAAMALAGAALQGLLRNPLVDPALIGVSQGAAIAAAAVFYFNFLGFLGVYATMAAGLLGAGLTLVALMGLSGPVARPTVIIMAGLAISALASALLALVLNFAPSPYAMQELVFWLLGSVAHQSLQQVLLLTPVLAIGMLLAFSQRRLLAGLSLGEQVAESMGLAVARGSRLIITAASSVTSFNCTS